MDTGETYKLIDVLANGDLLIEGKDGKRSVLHGVKIESDGCGLPADGVVQEGVTWKGITP